MKVYLAIGNKEIEEIIKEGNFDIVDESNSLDTVEDLLEFIKVDAIVINRLLDTNGEILRIAKKVKEKGINVLVLTDSLEDYEEQKYITKLVAEGVTGYITFEDLTVELAEEILFNYPKEFDFSIFSRNDESEQIKKGSKEEVIKSVFKEVIAVYSPLSQGSTTISTHLAMAIANAKNCRVGIADFNPLKPRFKKVFDTEFDYTLVDAIDAVVRNNLTYERLESFMKPSKYQKNLDLLAGIYDINEYYSSSSNQYEEIIKKMKFNNDYVILDTHSCYDVLSTDVALRQADKVIVPVNGNKHDIDELNRYLDGFRSYNDFDLRKFYVVINEYTGNDLTFIEIESKVKANIIGYISKHKDYEKNNSFKSIPVMNEYVDILNAIGIDAKKQKNFKETLINLIPFRKSS